MRNFSHEIRAIVSFSMGTSYCFPVRLSVIVSVSVVFLKDLFPVNNAERVSRHAHVIERDEMQNPGRKIGAQKAIGTCAVAGAFGTPWASVSPLN